MLLRGLIHLIVYLADALWAELVQMRNLTACGVSTEAMN